MDIKEIRRENLRRWSTEHGVPQSERSYFSQLLSGASFGERAARRLEEQYKMGAGYLDRDPGEAVAAAPQDSPFIDADSPVDGARPVRVGDMADTVAIPRVKLRLRAGVAGFDTEPDLAGDGHELVPRELLVTLQLKPENLMAMRVRGESMEPMMFEDDVVIVDKSDKKPISREVYAVNFNGDACIKQLIFKGGQWYLYSLHSDHGPVNVKSGQCSIVGRVVIQPARVLTGRL